MTRVLAVVSTFVTMYGHSTFGAILCLESLSFFLFFAKLDPQACFFVALSKTFIEVELVAFFSRFESGLCDDDGFS